MVVFRVTENINIKTTDGTLIKYNKIKGPANLYNETAYITTYEDFEDLKGVFSKVNEKYKARVIDENKVRYLSQFPKELGVTNINEFAITQSLDKKYRHLHANTSNHELQSLYLNEEKQILEKQLQGSLKEDISLLILGNLGLSISEMICACTSLRILYTKLRKNFKTVKIDIFLNASENKFYSRDKMIFQNQNFINKVNALGIDVKSFCNYDYFIDASSVINRSFYKHLNHIDAWLYKFGIDYTKVPESEKYNTLNISAYKPKNNLVKIIKNLKFLGKTFLFHPYSANLKKSIPKEVAVKLLKSLMKKLPDYTFVSTIKIDSKFNDDRFIDLSAHSQNIMDFAYIISNMSKVFTVNTATYHIAESFFIPTVVVFTNNEENQNIKSYETAKSILIEDKSKNFSQFIFDDDSLVLHRFDGWKKLKAKRIINLLESF